MFLGQKKKGGGGSRGVDESGRRSQICLLFFGDLIQTVVTSSEKCGSDNGLRPVLRQNEVLQFSI